MRTNILLGLSGLAVVVLAVLGSAGAVAQDEVDAQALFVDEHKCNVCHSVEAAGVEARSEKTFSGDLSGFAPEDAVALARFLRKEEARDGEDHKKTFKGSDEELQAILVWLATFEPVAAD